MPKPPRFCEVDSCGLPSHGHGMCNTHYRQWQRRGTHTWRRVGQVVDGKKICTRCREDKPLGEYGVNRALIGGLMVYCKPCTAAISREARERVGLEIINRRAKEFRARTPYYWREGNNVRRARVYGRDHETVKPTVVFDRDDWTCGICAGHIHRVLVHPHPMSPSVDHVVPLSRGGHHLYDNCQASHLTCNMRKHATLEGEPA